MSRHVLDTHGVVYALTAPGKLGRRARAALTRVEEGRDEAWVPAAVAAELVMLRELGRVEVGLNDLAAVMEKVPTLRYLDLDLRQIELFSTLSGIRDPFDRLIVAAALSLDATLVTRDARLGGEGAVRTVWS